MNYLDLVPPSAVPSNWAASKFKWGRIIGRLDCKDSNVELREMPSTLYLVSDTSGQTITFRWNGFKKPPIANAVTYGEYLSSDDAPIRLKLHISTVAWRRNQP